MCSCVPLTSSVPLCCKQAETSDNTLYRPRSPRFIYTYITVYVRTENVQCLFRYNRLQRIVARSSLEPLYHNTHSVIHTVLNCSFHDRSNCAWVFFHFTLCVTLPCMLVLMMTLIQCFTTACGNVNYQYSTKILTSF